MKKTKTNLSSIKKEKYFYRIIVFVLAILQMLFRAYNNSPLVGRCGTDGSMYLVMGRGILEGKILYRDLYDHKGPFIFWINALGQLITRNEVGVWFIEVLFMLISIYLLIKMAEQVCQGWAVVIPPLLYLLMMGISLNGGNYTEEYCNLSAIVSLYLWMKWKHDQKLSLWHGCILGILITFAFFMRANNAVIPGCVILWILIATLTKDKNTFLTYLLSGLCGIGFVAIPTIFVFAMQNTLPLMWEAAFRHNFLYCKDGLNGTLTGGTDWECIVILCLTVFICGRTLFRTGKKTGYCGFIIFTSVMSILAVSISGLFFCYYGMLLAPLASFAMTVYIENGTKEYQIFLQKRKMILLAGIILLMGAEWLFLDDLPQMKKDHNTYVTKAKELLSEVPEDERAEVFGYDTPAVWIYKAGLKPQMRYFCMQSWMTQTDPAIEDEIVNYVNNENPKWIVTYFKDASNNDAMKQIITHKYQINNSCLAGYLYERIDGEP